MPRALAALLLLCLTAVAGELHLTFHQSSYVGITNYEVFYGRSSYGYTNRIDCGTNGDLIISNLDVGTPWFFNVTSQSTNGLESSFTSELKASIPTATNSIVIFRGSGNPGGPWTTLSSVTNDASIPFQFYSTILIITNVP